MTTAHLSFDDRNHLRGLGRTFGLAVVLPADPIHYDTIRSGPKALREAADLYACAMNSAEQRQIVEAFVSGVSEHSTQSLNAMNFVLESLAADPKYMPQTRPLP